jgi:hypothetical protein
MYKLPNEIIVIISSYYPTKISKNLSDDINDQRLLYSIKEKEYYNKNTRCWTISKIGSILINQEYISEKLKKKYKNNVWKDKDNIVNKMWWNCSSSQRKKIVDENFKYAYENESRFITFNEFFYSNFGYYINKNFGIYGKFP